mmetsp:Transcript_96357/g.272525  ORF Transcript_96357/g.272525 Transcript_96357/m.272525 type:complete len:215 (+) Transcript_96357:76-720(+)
MQCVVTSPHEPAYIILPEMVKQGFTRQQDAARPADRLAESGRVEPSKQREATQPRPVARKAEPAAARPRALGGIEAQGFIDCSVPGLVRASERGELATVVELLRAGENPNVCDDFGLTALHGACKKGHAQVVLLLLQHKVDVNAKANIALHGVTPLHYACKYGHAEVAEMLLAGGADPRIMTDEGRMPLELAQAKQRVGVENLLKRALGIVGCS